MNRILRILKFAMRMERDAQKFYEYYADNTTSVETANLFLKLADIEEVHYDILRKQYDKLEISEPPKNISWVVDNTSSEKNPSILADNSELLSTGEDGSSDLMAIRTAFLMENDFAVFYDNAANSVEDPEVKAFLEKLKNWEIQHREMFRKQYDKLLKKHWGDLDSIIFN